MPYLNAQATPSAAAPAPSAQPAAPAAAQPATAAPAASAPDAGGDSAKSLKSLPVPHDLSPWSMFLSADIIVKAVMVGLAFASLVTWTIFFAKSLQIARARRSLRKALARLAQTRSLSEAQLASGFGRPVAFPTRGAAPARAGRARPGRDWS